MKTSLRTGILVLFCLLNAKVMHGQIPAANSAADTAVVTFRFLPEQDMFYIPWAGNGVQLEKLYAFLDEYRGEITAGRIPVYIDAHCASFPTPNENLRTAYVRANRVKSELITQKGLKEADFITANYATAYKKDKDVVVVTLCIPARVEPKRTEPVKEESEGEESPVEKVPRSEPTGEEETEPMTETVPAPDVPAKPYDFALRTNVLYDAFLLPTLGIEWRINNSIGFRLDGSLSRWGSEHGKVQKMWMLSPEVRWYLLENKRFYIGASGNYSKYNVYKYMLGNLMKDDTGYQGSLWGAGLTVGYQFPLSRHFSVDFNLGLGYTRSEYDRFYITDGVRVYKERDKTKNLWGPTQAGIHLVWTIGGNK